MKTFEIAVLAGDGIGQEVMTAAVDVLQTVCPSRFVFKDLPAGAGAYSELGADLPTATLDACRSADAIMLGAMGLPDVRKADGTELVPQIDLRIHLGLFGGVRPIRKIPNVPTILVSEQADDIDFVLVRESTEGLFASMHKAEISNEAVRDSLLITRHVSERLFDFSFKIAERRKRNGKAGRLTCIDKANVLQSMAFFRAIFDERAALFPNITTDAMYVDAMALQMVRQPWAYDVMVTENMYGDILSDLAAGLIGGMGFAPSADIGDKHAVFQPCHGTAPDIMGQGIANPTAMILSAAMMLDWLGQVHGDAGFIDAAKAIESAVDRTFAPDFLPYELGGKANTAMIKDRILSKL
ncbi:MAG: isocitrate/isopropylmalate dehydrogenase family protein [Alphaproteobacteria bacterium]